MKTFATLALAALTFGSVSAQEKEAKLKVLSDIKFSGYIMSQYQYSDKESNKGEKDINSFNIRMVRMALEGRVAKDFYWKAQLQGDLLKANDGHHYLHYQVEIGRAHV